MSADHHHGAQGTAHGHSRRARRALVFSIAANGVLLVVQVIVGLAIGSLALLADSLHNASDVVALVVALIGQALAARPPTRRISYGLARTEVLAALVNGAVLLALTGWVVVEAVGRFAEPQALDPGPLAAIGLLGLAVNGGSAWYLARAGGNSLNVRAAFWHLAGDALGSLGVVIAAAGVAWFGATWADPAASILISLLVIVGVLRLLRDTVGVLLEATPPGIDPDEVEAALAAVDGVSSVHHLHIWAIDSATTALTAHLELYDGTDLHTAQLVADACRATIAQRFGIGHATFEPECHHCASPHHVPEPAHPELTQGRGDPGSPRP